MRAIVLFVGLGCALTGLHGKPMPATPAKEKIAKAADQAIEVEAKIVGVTIARPDGSFLGITLEGGVFKLSFYDKKKKPTDIDVTRATARWAANYKSGDERTVLNPGGDGKSLVGNKHVRPPFTFKLWLTLLKGEGDDAKAVENYAIDFRA